MFFCGISHAQIYRCGNIYTNSPSNPENCKLVEGGNVRIVQGLPPAVVLRNASDKDKYLTCRTDAAKAPTQFGVEVGLNACNAKFTIPKPSE